MRSAIGIFGGVAGVIVVALVARYGYATSDTTIDGLIVAFFFAVIAVGGLGGPAVAVHLWKASQRSAKLWGIAAGIVAAVALLANLSNSLGAIAGRADQTQAQRFMASNAAKDDRAELARLIAERAKLPSFRPAGTVRADIDAGRASPRYKPSNSCDPTEITAKSTREFCEAFRRLEGELATAVEASRLDAAASAVRARLAKAPAVQSVNPLADVLGRILHMPAETAATWQQVATVVVVELLIAFALMAFELLHKPSAAERPAPMPATEPTAADGGISAAANRRVIGGVRLIEPPRPEQSGSVGRFMLACLPRTEGQEASWGAIYARYQRWCEEQSPAVAPVDLKSFGEQFRATCERVKIRIQQRGNRVYCMDVSLSA